MVQTATTPGFRSFTYRFGIVYNFVNKRLYEWNKKFITLAHLINKSKKQGSTLKVLDIACGTGYIAYYLDPSTYYTGIDLNPTFLKKLKYDWETGKIKVKKIRLHQLNIFDFEKYPKESMDVVLFSGILHHIYPRHMELVENAKKVANRIIICEPYAIKPADIDAHDWTAKLMMYLMKYLPERLYKWVDILLADNDGINSYEQRQEWNYNKLRLKKLYSKFGIKKIIPLKDEIIGVWDA